MIKKYLRPEQAAKYLTDKTGDTYSLDDIMDLANEGLISVVVYFNGGVTDFQSITGENSDAIEYSDEDRVIQIYRFEGYLKSRELIRFVSYSGWQEMPHPIDIYEPIETNYSRGGLFFYGVFATKYKYPTAFRNTDNYPAMFDADSHLFVPRHQLDCLIKDNSQVESENVNSKDHDECVEPITTLQAVGMMAELLAQDKVSFRRGDNVNAKAIGDAVAARARIRFGEDVRGFDSFNKKISEALNSLKSK